MAISRRDFLKRSVVVPIGATAAILVVGLGSEDSSEPDLISTAALRQMLDAEAVLARPGGFAAVLAPDMRRAIEQYNRAAAAWLSSMDRPDIFDLAKNFGAPRFMIDDQGGSPEVTR